MSIDMDRRKRIGIVGTGNSARMHAAILKQLDCINLCGVCSKSIERVREFGKEHGLGAYTSIREMVQSEGIEIALIANENFLHVRSAIESLDCGAHVLIEKPTGSKSEEIDELLRLSKHKNKLVGVVLQKRYDPYIVRLKGLIDEQFFGDILLVKVDVLMSRDVAHLRRILKLSQGSGITSVLEHLGIHLIDAVLWALDSSAVEVIACHSSKTRIDGISETCVVSVKMSNGSIISLSFTTAATERSKNKIEIIGTNNSALYKASGLYDSQGIILEPTSLPNTPSQSLDEIRALWLDFESAISHNATFRVALETVTPTENLLRRIATLSINNSDYR